MNILISADILQKLSKKHKVSPEEVEQCFLNRRGKLLEDTREDHKTNPATQWFVAETDKRRKLKIVFMILDGEIHLKSAYEPTDDSFRIYKKYAF